MFHIDMSEFDNHDYWKQGKKVKANLLFPQVV